MPQEVTEERPGLAKAAGVLIWLGGGHGRELDERHERSTHAVARAERDRAELDADTAIAVKRAEVRREAEILWAEHQLTQARLAIEAQTEIDREHQRRRVLQAFESPVHAPSRRAFESAAVESAEEDVYLPIAAEAEAASRAIAQLPAPEPGREVEPHHERNAPLIPSIPDATKAAARWIRPLVPPFVARVIDTTTQPLRTARHVFDGVLEETEEIAFALKRTRRGDGQFRGLERRAVSTRRRHRNLFYHPEFVTSSRHQKGATRLPAADRQPELTKPDGPREVGPREGPHQLPPAN